MQPPRLLFLRISFPLCIQACKIQLHPYLHIFLIHNIYLIINDFLPPLVPIFPSSSIHLSR